MTGNRAWTRASSETRTENRGVSTVLDVTLALLLISASVLLVGIYLNAADDEDALGDARADRTASTLSESTISVQYSLEGVDPIESRAGTADRTAYGSATGLLADAAVANVYVDGVQLFAYADDLEDAVDASISSELIGADHEFYVVAEWEPYDGAAINGTATAGERPPPDEDVSSLTMTASSGMPPVNETELEEAYLDAGEWWNDHLDDAPLIDDTKNKSFEAAGMVVGDAIIEGYFPPESTQLTLERQGVSRELQVYHYERMVAPLEYEFTGTTHPDHGGPLHRSGADATEANAQVLRGIENATHFGGDGLGHWIGQDLQRALSDDIDAIDDEYDGDARAKRIARLVAEAVSTDEVTITVHTWDP